MSCFKSSLTTRRPLLPLTPSSQAASWIGRNVRGPEEVGGVSLWEHEG